MTVMVAESAAGAVERGSIRKAPAKRARGEVVSRTDRRVHDTYNTRTRQRAAAPRQAPRQARRVQPGVNISRSRGGRGTGNRNYQGIILAEFVGAVMITAALPIFSGPPEDGKVSPSPYRVNDMVQLAALGGTYFILALIGTSPRGGRLAAWFGGLIMLGLLVRKTASGQLSAALGPSFTDRVQGSQGQDQGQTGPA